MPYQERQTSEDDVHADDNAPGAPPRGSAKFVFVVVLIALVAGGIATAFALLHSP